jgi:TfoX/Sxy family transcriptional regulator of competence genes
MSVSPEADFLKDQDKILEWSKKSIEWLETKFGKENIIKSHLHLDEKTPHLHTFPR